MKYKLSEQKNKVKSYKIVSNLLTLVNDKGLFVGDNMIEKNVDRTNYGIFDQQHVFIKNGKTYIGNRSIEKSILIDSLSLETAIFSSSLNLQKCTLHYELLNIHDFSLVYDFGELGIIQKVTRQKDWIHLLVQEKLISMNLSNHSLNWDLNIKILKVLGLFKDQLYLASNNHNILVVNSVNGKVIHEWRELPGFKIGSLYTDLIPDPTSFVLDTNNAKLIGVFDTYYFEINVLSREIKYKNLEDELNKKNIKAFRPFSDSPFTNDYLFLTAHSFLTEMPNTDFSSLLALNRKTLQVDWTNLFQNAGLGTNTPQINDSHLYQRDIEKTLHIFEKQ